MKKISLILFTIFLFFSSANSKELNDQNIFVFGDSHIMEFQNIPGCILINFPSVTMHRLGRDKLALMDLGNYPVKEGDVIIFSFGQIDVAWNIIKQRDTRQRCIDEILRTLVDGYMSAINLITKEHPNIIRIVYSITPATNNTNIPFSGTLEERIMLTKLMNGLLESECIKNTIEFLDVHDDYADQNGVLITELSDNTFHIDAIHNGVIQKKLFEIIQKY